MEKPLALKMFDEGIKPALLMNFETAINYYPLNQIIPTNIGRDVLVVQASQYNNYLKDINNIKNDKSEIGKILGYYPAAADEFAKNRGKQEIKIGNFIFTITNFLNFNDIDFNVPTYMVNDALNWCKLKYGIKTLSRFGKINIKKRMIITISSKRGSIFTENMFTYYNRTIKKL